MRITEIILKLGFLALSIYVIVTKHVIGHSFLALLAVALLLGIVLIFNSKHPSYRYPADYRYNNRVLVMRRIEGILLAASSIAMLVIIHVVLR